MEVEAIRVDELSSHTIDPVSVFVVLVVAELVLEVDTYKQAAGEADCQTDPIDEGVGPVSIVLSKSDLDVMQEHRKVV